MLIVVDAAAFMDFGGYGGEARTPHLDALGDAGVRFTNYHTSPLCAPSRAMLLTGNDNHLTGVATIPEVVVPDHRSNAGYSMSLLPEVETLATRLQRHGYRTYMTGKWHLGGSAQSLPSGKGFQRSFLTLTGAESLSSADRVPMTGRSLVPVLSGLKQQIYGPDDAVGMEASGNSALFRGDRKLRRVSAPFGDEKWRMYDIQRDPT